MESVSRFPWANPAIPAYQVVEVTDPRAPILATAAPAPVHLGSLGYRPIVVAEEKARPVIEASNPEQLRPLPRRAHARRQHLALCILFSIVGVMFVLLCAAAMVFMSVQDMDAPRRMAWVQEEFPVPVAPQQVMLPDEPIPAQRAAALNNPVVVVQPPEAKDCAGGPENDCKVCAAGKLVDRDTLGTAVGFVRNPLEAALLARAERKLTYILHVSGNFEDARFT